MEKFTCIIPTLDRHEMLFPLLESFSEQTRLPNEIVIIDQSEVVSHENKNLYQKLALWLPLKIFRLPPIGSGAARNLGIIKSNFPVLVFLDDDVELLRKDFFEAHLKWFDFDFIDVIDSGYIPYGDERDVERTNVNLQNFNLVNAITGTYHNFNSPKQARCNIGICGGNFSARKDSLERVNGFDGRCDPVEDRELGIRLWKSGEIIINDSSLRIKHLKCNHGGLRHGKKKIFEIFRIPNDSPFLLLMIHFNFSQLVIVWLGDLFRTINFRNPRTFLRFPIKTITMCLSLIKGIKKYTNTKPTGILTAPGRNIEEWKP